ncbi:MAG TPA: XrtA-associated tyrosine autokinase [Steroidobacteraceae bacterium]|jgi:exopolysaccharide/PEP-CTERM locus tyrosine autokinase|nr:XrtA-associated tyrosine autokinase [Steroidobacteraceae bacterium]
MSLVELALKKMQSAARSAVPGAHAPVVRPPGVGETRSNLPQGVVGEVVQRSSHRKIENADGSLAQVSEKVIHIDQNALRAAGLVPPEHQQRALADQYRQIKRPLISQAIGRGAGSTRLDRGQLIMMASAMPGEGKTFTAINLAMSMAMEKDVSVLLVDADVAKPHISRTFGVENEPGLLDVLRDADSNVEAMILPTDVPGLSVLPSGRRSETATELLASHRMEETVRYLAESDAARIVLIDSPPLLLTSESRALAHWVGQVVIVVRADSTPQQAVLDAIDYLDEGKSISLVLNQSKTSTPGYYYGFGDASDSPPP